MGSQPKLLVRAWLPGLGCRYFRSKEMTEAEARALYNAASAVIQRLNEPGDIEEIPGAQNRAFVMARPTPDPNQPNRMAQVYVLLSIPDQEAFLRDAVAERLRAIEVPGESDAISGGWEVFDQGAMPPDEAVGGAGHEPTSGGRFGVKRWLYRNWHLVGVVAAIVILAVGAFAFEHRSRPASSPDNSHKPPTVESPGLPDENQAKWDERRAMIEDLLDDLWARRILNNPPLLDFEVPEKAKDLNDGQILRVFARLFQRPSIDLQEEDERNFKQMEQKEPQSHPFIAFLNRLPVNPPISPDGGDKFSAPKALGYLEELDRALRASSLKLDLNFDDPNETKQHIKMALAYGEFYKVWDRQHTGHRCKGSLDDDHEKDEPLYYGWVKDVRNVINAYRPPQ